MKEVEKELEWARWRKSMWTTFYSGSIKDILCIEKLERDAAADEDYITQADSESETIETDTDTTETETTGTETTETFGMEATDIDHEDS